jgi:hypothetical protein
MPFVTTDWLTDPPTFLRRGVLDAARLLNDGQALCERFPQVWPHRAVVVAPSPSVSSPSAPSPAQSQPSGPSPLAVPPMSRSPSSSSGAPSPVSGVAPSQAAAGPVGPAGESVPRRGRSAARPAYRRPAVSVPKAIPAPVPVPVAASAPAPAPAPAPPSSQPTRASKKRPLADVEMDPRPEGWKSCKRCSARKQRCAPLKGTQKPPCALCQLDKVECLPQSGVPSEFFALAAFPD